MTLCALHLLNPKPFNLKYLKQYMYSCWPASHGDGVGVCGTQPMQKGSATHAHACTGLTLLLLLLLQVSEAAKVLYCTESEFVSPVINTGLWSGASSALISS